MISEEIKRRTETIERIRGELEKEEFELANLREEISIEDAIRGSSWVLTDTSLQHERVSLRMSESWRAGISSVFIGEDGEGNGCRFKINNVTIIFKYWSCEMFGYINDVNLIIGNLNLKVYKAGYRKRIEDEITVSNERLLITERLNSS